MDAQSYGNHYFWLIPLLPLLGSAFHGLVGKRAGRLTTALVGVGVVLASLGLSMIAFFAARQAPGLRLEFTYFDWMNVGALRVPFGITLDSLSTTMALAVSGISALIHIYSIGYMWEDKGFARFFAYMNLFVFFMLTLVLGSSLPLLFVGWEGVGLCSYLLIGYFYETEEAPSAGMKAFLTNRVGDLGMLLGMMLLFAHFGTLTISDILTRSGSLSPEVGFGILTLATLMLFLGATGKSAQIPLYIWLPDAMAGPTPVSALIHAATMVTAGIFLVCRLAPLFVLAPITLNVIAWVGALTALFAATIGLLQRDIKKVLAYSTVSQLGYMFLALGSTGFAAGFYHLFTHAWFKALLFLGAGSVIHALHSGFHHAKAEDGIPAEQDLFRMGGLRKKMPITFYTMLFATLCIIGFPFTSGFASKDEILYLAFLKHPMLWVIGVAAACCTAFYMLRLLTLTFLGDPRDEAAHKSAHESGPSMTFPLIALALGALLAVFLGWPEAFGGSFAISHLLESALSFGRADMPHPHGSHGLAWTLALVSTTLSLGAAAFGYLSYRNGLSMAEARASRFPKLHRVIYQKYFVDEGLERFIYAPLRWFSNLLWRAVDVVFIDGLGVNAPGALARLAGDGLALFQTGRVRNYVLLMALGATMLFWVFLAT